MKNFRYAITVPCIGALLLSALFLAGCEEKPMKLRLSLIWPSVHPYYALLEEYGKDIEKVTEGRITVSLFPASTLSPPMQVYDNTVKGIVDIGACLLAYSPGRLPLSEVLQLPLGYKSGYQASKLANAYYKKFKPAEFEDVKVMFLHGAAPGLIFTKNPVRSTADIKGLRIKANAENANIVTALGASPVTLTVGETYDGLSRGIIEGTLFPLEALQGFKIGEVVKTVLENYGMSYMTSMYIIMNKEKWERISPADQKEIEKLNDIYNEKFAETWVILDNKAREFAASKGVEFVKVSGMETANTAEKMKPILDKYIEMTKTKGLPGEEALEFAREFLEQNP